MTFEIKQYEDIVNDIVERLLSANTNLTDLNESSILRMLIETYSLELESEEFNGVYQQIQAVYEATRISTSTGDDLDEIGKLVGVTRKEGAYSSSNVSMVRVTPSFVDFVVTAGTTISTQPDGETQTKRFTANEDTIFYATIDDEEQVFIDGIYDYKLEQRFYSSISGVLAYFSGVETPMVKDTNYEEVINYQGKIIDTSTIVVVDTCETITDWMASTDADAPTADVVNKRQGTASIAGGKTGTSSSSCAYYKTYATGFDLTGKTPNLKVRIANQTELDKINYVEVSLGDSAIDYLIFNIPKSDLSVGWNELYLDTASATSQGTPQIGDIKWVKVDFQTNSAADTIANGDINIDFIIFGDIIEYQGDILRIIDDGTLPDSGTNVKTTYVPLSVEVLCTAENIGTEYNVGTGKLTYKVSQLTNIVSVYNYEMAENGEDIESDDSLRTRITESTSGLGKATVDAIETAVGALDFVTSSNVVDMPLLNHTQSIAFITGTADYQLGYEVAQQNENLKLTVDRSITTESLTDVDTTISVSNASSYSTAGFIIIDDEIIQYNGVSGNDIENCVRGSEGTTATTHNISADAKQWYKPGTDFTVNNASQVSWTGTGNEPGNGEFFDTYFEYRWLAHIEVFVSGPFTFTTAQNLSITTTIEDYKAAGIAYTYTTPTVVNINVNASIKLKPGFSFGTIQPLVVAALDTKINTYAISENIYISQLIDAIMGIDGVDYTEIAIPTGTVIIAESEIAKAGTIIINQI